MESSRILAEEKKVILKAPKMYRSNSTNFDSCHQKDKIYTGLGTGPPRNKIVVNSSYAIIHGRVLCCLKPQKVNASNQRQRLNQEHLQILLIFESILIFVQRTKACFKWAFDKIKSE